MIRRSFLKRMALAAAACALIDVPWPKEQPRSSTTKPANVETQAVTVISGFAVMPPEGWTRIETDVDEADLFYKVGAFDVPLTVTFSEGPYRAITIETYAPREVMR